ncbi:hypothetical protein SNS2_1382 [Streptomyces netropsis]|uniref:PknH-like extracellular domain-containing protein n=1 Tax=Streptomyces syringium TaxID=76729 RepID=A0ABS4Y1Z4_9ACTN|nr:hypothetical protein [Streptomyces syringium]MBP2402802.1 hypothetical protein [Streptomyces syringium]SPE49691.1 hypothetical protein SNS2_1382 [Streptomyces netropsis]
MRPHPRRGASAVLAASALLLVSACGGAPGRERPADHGSRPEATRDAAGGQAKGTPQAKPLTPLTGEQAKAAVLTAGDLPSGWKVMGDASDVFGPGLLQIGTTEKKPCQPLLDAFVGRSDGPKPAAHAMAELVQSGDAGSMLVNGVTAYREADAVKIMRGTLDVDACESFSGKLGDDRKADFTAERLDVPKTGDESRAVRVTVAETANEVSMQHDIAAARVGATIVTVVRTSFSTADSSSFEDALAKVVEKVKKTKQAK